MRSISIKISYLPEAIHQMEKLGLSTNDIESIWMSGSAKGGNRLESIIANGYKIVINPCLHRVNQVFKI